MGIHNPLPSSLASECKKCAKILSSFIDPRQSFGPDKIIPPSVLASSKGIAVLTVLKAGFLGSARFGSGLVVARLPDGTWSAPSAIMTGGAGFGGQIGFELTDFVFILNDTAAVKTFAQAGSLTLGGNVSIAAGPVGRNAEAAGAASIRSVAGIFAYSKTKGLFAGVSLEGSIILERKDANARMYGRPISARELLSGRERPPPAAAPLINVLSSRAFSGMSGTGYLDDRMYNDIPIYDDHHDDVIWAGKRGLAYGEGQPRERDRDRDGDVHAWDEFGRPKRSSAWQDDYYDNPRNYDGPSRSRTFSDSFDRDASDRTFVRDSPSSPSTQQKTAPGRPAAPKPNYTSKENLMKKNQAIALYTFEPEQPGDLGFKKGEIITILKKTDSDNDWWTGMIGTRHGIFPSNYVKMLE
ncbi:putative LAS seventeen-binding protein [Thermochaetoides thermophila DSM 1495]|uniref:Putative LAS seventeen-binding protein n=1 Tax=Chaetomium thermophilum (strain DSM 1495 / CBS 144.50 / IMI 039719) TaxID=759272 RepID=G0S914_CHATD|nr:putative LAS seventeen-binding protein [Thermochaetoides thermophila DSM 1495]EGS19925.1 putative LAS seventeen-binding protein [Thermochaetoides thermophila DSM 1495]